MFDPPIWVLLLSETVPTPSKKLPKSIRWPADGSWQLVGPVLGQCYSKKGPDRGVKHRRKHIPRSQLPSNALLLQEVVLQNRRWCEDLSSREPVRVGGVRIGVAILMFGLIFVNLVTPKLVQNRPKHQVLRHKTHAWVAGL